MNKILKYVINGVCIAAIGTGLIVGNQVLKQFETEIDTALTPKLLTLTKLMLVLKMVKLYQKELWKKEQSFSIMKIILYH